MLVLWPNKIMAFIIEIWALCFGKSDCFAAAKSTDKRIKLNSKKRKVSREEFNLPHLWSQYSYKFAPVICLRAQKALHSCYLFASKQHSIYTKKKRKHGMMKRWNQNLKYYPALTRFFICASCRVSEFCLSVSSIGFVRIIFPLSLCYVRGKKFMYFE